jgi:ribosome-associated heat shock protein Hsp15
MGQNVSQGQSGHATIEKMRLDKWLWAARFFKTRSLASEAISKSQIKVGRQRVKPSRNIAVGDTILVEKAPYQQEVTVLGLSEQRRPAVEAQQLYEELASSVELRESLANRLRIERQMNPHLVSDGRPSKKQRRQIIRFQNKQDRPTDPDQE